jgi:hypothetical protein
MATRLQAGLPRHSLRRGVQFARSVNKQRTIAQSVLDSTLLDEETTDQVSEWEAGEMFVIGMIGHKIVVEQGQIFYQVRSRFAGRHYVVFQKDGIWFCSSASAPEHFIRQVQQFLAEH